ncbi:MAG: heme biosynthesis HemY N-terminal domain-containing protein [Pseudomonadota bacterium]
MIRIFTYLVFVVVAVWGFTILADIAGYTVVELDGTRIDVPTSILLGVLVVAGVLFFFGGTIVAWLWGLPGRFKRRGEERRRARGMTALTRGLEAVAAGDAGDAQRHAKTATKTLDEPGLTRLLTAQAAQLAGDSITAEQSYTAMLEAPETEFLGLRGLYLQAMQSGATDEARGHAERAFQLRPGTPWAFESVLSLSLENGAWSDALEAITLARQNKIAQDDEFKRMEAALLTARAYATFEGGDSDAAVKDAELALKKAGSLTPAAALAAEAHVQAGQRSKAAKVLGDAWQAEAHPGLANVLRRVFENEREERVQGRLVKLTERAPDHPESRLLLAEVQLQGGDAAAAQGTLEPLLAGRPQRRVLTLMADITEKRYGAEAAEKWKTRANAAPLDVVPGMDGVFHYTTEGWRRLIREFSEFARLAPPPLQVEIPELAADEVRALLAPPPEPAAAEETADSEAMPEASEPDTVAEESADQESADEAAENDALKRSA